MTEIWRWGFVIMAGFIMLCVILVRQAHREDRAEERMRQKEQDQYEQQKKDRDEGNDNSTEADENDYNQRSEYAGAYLTKPTKKRVTKMPPKASSVSQERNQLLTTIKEGDEAKEDEDEIEEIECPGVDGRQNQLPARGHPMMYQRRQFPRKTQ